MRSDDDMRCIICGKEIDEWGGFATLVYYDEVYSEECGESIELFIKDWCIYARSVGRRSLRTSTR